MGRVSYMQAHQLRTIQLEHCTPSTRTQHLESQYVLPTTESKLACYV